MTPQEEIAACQKELGYEDGTLLENLQRFTRYVRGEIEALTKGGQRVTAYAESLQAKLSEKDIMEVAGKALDEAFPSPQMTARDCALEHRFHENLKGHL